MIIILNYFFLLTCVIGLASIGAKIIERSGTAAVHIEGVMTISGVTFLLLINSFGTINLGYIFLSIMITCLAGIIYNFIFSIMTISLKGNQFIIGIGMNIIAPVIGFIIVSKTEHKRGLPTALMRDMMASNNFNYLYLIFFFVFLIVLAIVFVFMYKSKFGIKLNAIGENPYALQNAGVKISSTLYIYHMIGAIIVSIAGCIMTYLPFLWADGTTFNGLKSAGGLGFIALGIVILSSWKIKWLGVFTLFFGAALAFFYNISVFTTSHLWLNTMLQSVPYLLTIVALPFISKKGIFPSQLGRPFIKNKRALD